MKRFRFQLDPLLRMRKAAEQEKQRAVAELERKRIAIEDQIRRLQQNLEQGQDSIRKAVIGRVHLPTIRAQANAVMSAIRCANELVLQLAAAQKEVESARTVLLEATKLRRAMEILRDRRLQEWKTDTKRAAQRDADDYATARPGQKGDFA